MGKAKKNLTVFLHLLVFLILLCTASCNTTEPPDPPITPQPKATLTQQDASCLEAWIKLEIENIELPVNVTLTKDSIPILQINNLTSSDTIVCIDSLQPNQTYEFQSIIQPTNQSSVVKSNELNVTTLDTTSQNFTWQTFTFGDHGNSVLFDVAIVGNEIWAVGEIYMKDSLGNPDNNFYNLIKWNGSNWSLERVYYNYQGSNFLAPLRSIFAFAENDVWVGSNQPMLWNGIIWEKWDLLGNIWEGWINKIWGSSSNDLYVVGNNGNIAHYNDSQWRKLESGTNVDLLDIWGSPDGTVWACGYTNDYSVTVLLRYDGFTWNKVYEGSGNNQNNNEFIGPASGVWTNSKFFTYVASWGKIYRQPNDNILNIKRVTPNFSDVAFAMRGTDHNNIFVAGQDGLVGHYNGVTYTEFNELKENGKNYFGIAVKDNIAVAVGVKYGGLSSQAVISIGRR